MTESAPGGGPTRAAGVRLTLALALLASAGSLLPVVTGAGWLVELAATAAVLTVVSVVMGQLRAPAALIAAGQLAAAALVLTVVHVPAQAIAGVLPGPAALGQAGVLIDGALQVVDQQSAPIDATSGVALALTGCGALVLVVLDALVVGARRPALAGVPLLVVHAVGAVFAPVGLGGVAFVAAAGGYLAVLLVARGSGPRWGPVLAPRAAPRRRRPGPAPLAVGVALVMALALPALAPLPAGGVRLGGGGGDGSTSVNPLLDLREDLTDRSDTVVLRYDTDQEDPQPLRLVTVDSFDGDLWRPTDVGAEPLPSSGELGIAPGLAQDTASTPHRQSITLETLRQEYLPLPYPVSSLEVDGDWRVDPATGTVSGAGRTRTEPGQTYAVDYLQVAPDPSALAAAPPAPQDLVERYTQVPDDLPPQISETAAVVTQDAGSAYDQAVALQTWFRSDGGFEYTVDAPTPDSSSALADFLTDKRGYCVHFSSEMAVMARTLGIPARVAIGFLPGRSTPDGWEVQASDAHAWPELWFEGVGWTRFEPTPSVQTGAAPAWTVPAADPAETGGAEQPQSEPQPSVAPGEPAPAPTDDPGATGADDPAGAQGSGAAAVVAAVAAVLGVSALLVLLAGVPALARNVRSARRWSTARGDGDGALAEAAWSDLVERAGDLGVGIAPSDTPRRTGERLVEAAAAAVEGTTDGGTTGGDGEAGCGDQAVGLRVARLVAAIESTRYGAAARRAPTPRGGSVVLLEAPRASDPEALRSEALEVVRTLATTVGARARWASAWWPASGRSALRHLVRGRP